MGSVGLPPNAVRVLLRGFSRWALAPSLPWPAIRRRVEIGLRYPPPPRSVRITHRRIGGVPCAVHLPAGVSGGPTLLYLHGGGWTFGSAQAYRSLGARLARALGQQVVVADYRLTPDWPYDAQVADVRAVWDALEDQVGAADLILGGDSAGGQLTLVLALALRDEGRPLPRALGIVCPLVDMTPEALAAHGRGEREPLLSPQLIHRCTAAALDGGDPREPRFSPLHADLAGLPPMVIDTGEDDLIRRDGVRLADAARAAGVYVDHVDLTALWHVPHLSAQLLGGEAGRVVDRFAARLRAAG
ncbi:MAG TPA: alpha/beta hydrolase [Pseudonocardia sp.]|nr:alpha/beta hydrolase [Pseudonocardia sp.]